MVKGSSLFRGCAQVIATAVLPVSRESSGVTGGAEKA